MAEAAPHVEVLRLDTIPLGPSLLQALRPALARFPALRTLCLSPATGPYTAESFWQAQCKHYTQWHVSRQLRRV